MVLCGGLCGGKAVGLVGGDAGKQWCFVVAFVVAKQLG